MKVCALSFHPKLLKSFDLNDFDLIILPDSLAYIDELDLKRPMEFVSITPIDHNVEFEILSEFVEKIRIQLDGIIQPEIWPLMSRSIYLSAVKSELRFFTHMASALDRLGIERVESVTIFHRYCAVNDFFTDFEKKIKWVPINTTPSPYLNMPAKFFRRLLRRCVRLGLKLVRYFFRYSKLFIRVLGKFRS